MAKLSDNQRIWKTLSKAIGAEFRESTTIKGASGLDHPVQAIAVDDKTRRILIISAEQSPRIAALMQVDVQATIPDAKVLVARPVLFDLAEIARRVIPAFGHGALELPTISKTFSEWRSLAEAEQQKYFEENVAPAIKPLFETSARVNLPMTSMILSGVHQLVNLDWQTTLGELPSIDGVLTMLFSIMNTDSTEPDRNAGICPLPLYEFKEADWELILAGRRVADVRERLKELGIFQYFFPAPEQLLLGIADQHVSKIDSLIEVAEKVPALGHPIGQPEIFPDAKSLRDVLDALKGTGYVAEAEIGVTITQSGREVRQQVKVLPREGLIQKISRLFSVKADISLKDLFPKG